MKFQEIEPITQFIVAAIVNLLAKNVIIIKIRTESVLDTSKETV
jgi:hypothetical protein